MEKHNLQEPAETTRAVGPLKDRQRQKGRGTIVLLRVTGGPDILSYLVLHPGDHIEIGRDPLCNFSLLDSSVSRRHAGLDYRNEQFFLEDYSSRNGTFLNGHKIQSAILFPGDRLEIGSIPVRLEWVTQQELAEHQQIVQQLKNSGLDPLTGLYTRAFFQDYLPTQLEKHRQADRPITALFFDIDHFKNVNDRFGHATGDSVLKTAAQLLQSTVRRQDACIRYGGEEMVVIMPDTRATDAGVFAARFRARLQDHPWTKTHPSLAVTVSGGIAQWKPAEEIKDWLDRADQALYEAKQSGRNRIVLSSSLASTKKTSAD
jgi:two-component system, cell cycle response regulator